MLDMLRDANWARRLAEGGRPAEWWGKTIPLVVLSGHADVADRAAQLGAVAGILKPFDVDARMGTVQRLVPLAD
jgi:hypothetical protein